MSVPLEISARHMALTARLEDRIRSCAGDLHRSCDAIRSCHVTVEAPLEYGGACYRARVEVRLRGALVVATSPPRSAPHEALRMAIGSMRRQIEERSRRDVRRLVGQVSRMFQRAGYGMLSTEDGRDVVFHRARIRPGTFERLERGAEVRFVEEDSEVTSIEIIEAA